MPLVRDLALHRLPSFQERHAEKYARHRCALAALLPALLRFMPQRPEWGPVALCSLAGLVLLRAPALTPAALSFRAPVRTARHVLSREAGAEIASIEHRARGWWQLETRRTGTRKQPTIQLGLAHGEDARRHGRGEASDRAQLGSPTRWAWCWSSRRSGAELSQLSHPEPPTRRRTRCSPRAPRP